MKRKRVKNYYIVFSVVFLLVSIVAFAPFWLNKRSFIWSDYTKDGLVQHYNALMYLGKWGREIIITLLRDHKLSVPMWDFSIGYGTDIISSLHYYAFGDPLNLLSILVPSQYTEHLYNFLVVFRVYLAGVTFSKFSLYMKKDRQATFFGAFIYMFCGYTLFSFARHPFFMTPMIYFPLLLLGAEKVMKKQGKAVFIGVVGTMTLCNFYFSYMMLVLLIIYVAVRFFSKKHENLIKEGCCLACRFCGCILVGLAIACVIFVPVVLFLFSGDRISEKYVVGLFYDMKQYGAMLASVLRVKEADYYTAIGIVPVAIVAAIVMFSQKGKYKELKIGFIILSIMLCIPMIGQIMNGMSYASNRWVFAYELILAYIFTTVWPDLFDIKRRQKLFFTIFSIIYFVILVVGNEATDEGTLAAFVLMLFFFLLLDYKGENAEKRKKGIAFGMACLLVLSIGINVKYRYGVNERGYVKQFINRGTARNELYSSGAFALRKVKGEVQEMERLDDPTGLKNSAWQNDTYGINYYCSIENGAISRFLDEMGIANHLTQFYQGLDSRTMLNESASVKYFADQKPDDKLPFGYEVIGTGKVKSKGENINYKIAENQYALPLGYTYENYITREEYDKMTPIQRQQAIMQGVVLENRTDEYDKAKIKYCDQNIDYKVKLSDGINYENGKYIVTKNNAKMTLEFEGEKNSETYVYVNGIKMRGVSEKELYFDDYKDEFTIESWEKLSPMERRQIGLSDKEFKEPEQYTLKVSSRYGTESILYQSEKSKYFHGQKEYVVNLGFHEEKITSAEISFPGRGVYELEDIQVICQPMTQYMEDVEKLKEDVMEEERIETNEVTGKVSLDREKILCLSIPYTKGWTAYVDGEETEILQANSMYMALPLDEGDHTIKLKYYTPGIKLGMYLSALGGIVFVLILISEKKTNKRRKE